MINITAKLLDNLLVATQDDQIIWYNSEGFDCCETEYNGQGYIICKYETNENEYEITLSHWGEFDDTVYGSNSHFYRKLLKLATTVWEKRQITA